MGFKVTYSVLQFADGFMGSVQLVVLGRQSVLGVRQRLLHLLLQDSMGGDVEEIHHHLSFYIIVAARINFFFRALD